MVDGKTGASGRQVERGEREIPKAENRIRCCLARSGGYVTIGNNGRGAMGGATRGKSEKIGETKGTNPN